MDSRGAWNDWRWQMDEARGFALRSEIEVSRAADRFPPFATPYYRSLVDPADAADPIRRMIEPSEDEERPGPLGTDDPIREEAHAVLPGLVRRYPDRALLLLCGECAVHCRHCTRRILGRGRLAPVRGAELDGALAHIAENPEIRDVILSGGDPLLLEDEEILAVASRVREIPSVEIIRIHTRAPVALPMRITAELARGLAASGPLFVNTQFNHPRELTAEATGAVGRLVDAGIPVSNQAVLLAGVNDDAGVMEALSRRLLAARVRPYYLFMCDLVDGTEHFRVPLGEAVAIVERLRGKVSGLGIPELVVDLPGGLGKVPVGPSHVVAREAGGYTLRSPSGELVPYPDPPPRPVR